jgi:hypothetical protein
VILAICGAAAAACGASATTPPVSNAPAQSPVRSFLIRDKGFSLRGVKSAGI